MKPGWDLGQTFAQQLRQASNDGPDADRTIANILSRKREFGISRVASLTGLDRTGIPVVQAVRPLSLAVSVAHGKGLTVQQATISALMESLECWAAERVETGRLWQASFAEQDASETWAHIWQDLPADAKCHPIQWISGWDLLSQESRPVPLALVDTAYVVPSPHPPWFERCTTGLAAGTSLRHAVEHACFEIVESHVISLAADTPHFFDRHQVRPDSVQEGASATILSLLMQAGFHVGIWSAPTYAGLHVFWCQIMEGPDHHPFASYPAAGFACDITSDGALSGALLEACQSRIGAISATREDVTIAFYQTTDQQALADWRSSFQNGSPYSSVGSTADTDRLQQVLSAIAELGAKGAFATLLLADPDIPAYVVRVVAPPLRAEPGI